jgi:excinuclease ABC subunit A
MKWSGITAKPREYGYYKGIIPVMEEILKRDRNPNILRFAKTQKCSVCNAKRLNEKALSVKIKDKNIAELSQMNLSDLKQFINSLTTSGNNILEKISKEIIKRLDSLISLGLEHLNLFIKAESLSPGEIQRIHLSKLIHSKLQNVCFVFDEPVSGVYPAEKNTIISYLKQLRNNGNTVIVVEHDIQTILNADNIIDIGPKSGTNGGEVLFAGSLSEFLSRKPENSITGKYIYGKYELTSIKKQKQKNEFFHLKINGKDKSDNISVTLEKNAINVVCGKTGTGKKEFVFNTLLSSLINS